MKFESLDSSIVAAQRFLAVAKSLQRDCSVDRSQFPAHTYVSCDHARKIAETKRLSTDLSNALTILRRKT